MRFVLIGDAYPPFRNSGAVQLRDLAREFALQGHELFVVVPSAEQKAPCTVEFADGVTVLRLSALQTKDIGRFRRAVGEMLMPFIMLWCMRRSSIPFTHLDGIIWYSPTIFFGPLIHALKRSNGCRSYLILRDLFPDFAVDIGLLNRGLAYRLLKAVERYQYSLADTIGVQSESNLSYLFEWARNPKRCLEVLDNWLANAPNIDSGLLIASTPLSGKTVFVYAGNMGVNQGMDIVLDLAERLATRTDVGFLLVGRGTEVSRLKKEATKRELINVMFHDEIDPEEIPGLLAQCHIGLVLLDPRHKTHNVPGKLLAYMQAGLPILARINDGNDLANLITENDIGFVHVGGSLDAFQALAENLIEDNVRRQVMSSNARATVAVRFSPSVACKKIVAALSRQ